MSAGRAPASRLAGLIAGSRRTVVLTGAGISVPSGIPDFRTPGTGLWTGVDPMVAHIDVFRRDPARFWHFYGERFQTLEHKQPNRGHQILAELEGRGLIEAVITQNIDRLHARAGTRRLLEVHGSIAHSSCPGCGGRCEQAEVRRRQEAATEGVPRCDCGRPLKPDVVLFGEYLPAAAIAEAERLAASAELLLCIGTSLEVHPVAGLPSTTLAAGGSIAIITRGPTPLDRRATVRLDGDVVEELEAVWAELAR